MKLQLINKFTNSEAIIIPLFDQKNTEWKKALPANLISEIAPIIANKIDGQKFTTEIIHAIHKKNSISLYFISLGKEKNSNKEKLKEAGAKIANKIKEKKYNNITLLLNHSKNNDLAQYFTLGFALANYKFDHYFTSKNKKAHQYKNINILANKNQLTEEKIKEINIVTEAIFYTRDLVNMPPNDMTPTKLAKEAQSLGKTSKEIKVTIFDEKKLNKLKMGLILGVGAGSNEESKMIFMEYKKKPKNKKPILIVGKGITFDAGGLNIKPTNYIEDMKSDMAGAASVLGVMNILSKLKPDLHVVGVISAAENLLGSKAMKPGDILTAYNGKTVEITNTDAEGRLVLADALAYSTEKYQPEFVLDLATLTGSVIVALGYHTTGVITNNDKLFNKLQSASELTTEAVWQLPLTEEFKEKVNNNISDYKNWTDGVKAGSSMGAAFLEKFINNTPWLHLDIAGTSWSGKDLPTSHTGATGKPVHTVWELIKQYC